MWRPKTMKCCYSNTTTTHPSTHSLSVVSNDWMQHSCFGNWMVNKDFDSLIFRIMEQCFHILFHSEKKKEPAIDNSWWENQNPKKISKIIIDFNFRLINSLNPKEVYQTYNQNQAVKNCRDQTIRSTTQTMETRNKTTTRDLIGK